MRSVGRTSTVAAFLLAAALGPTLAAAEKKDGPAADLSAFFAEMDKTYPFFDLKDIRKGWGPCKERLLKKARACTSDQEFLGIVYETIGYLRDEHMRILKSRVEPAPGEPEWYPGISLMPAAGKRVIVLAAPERLAKDLPIGTVVSKIDGRDARTLLDLKAQEAWDRGGTFSSKQRARLFEYRIALRGKQGEKHKLTVLDGKKARDVPVECDIEARGWPHTYNLPEKLTPHGRSYQYGILPGGAGYIHLREIGPDAEPAIAAALAASADARGWIIDIRGNGGGGYGAELLKRIAAIPRPVACIIDAGCVSAGETLARDLVAGCGARLLGSATAGASSAKRSWDFPSGIATISIPTRSRFGPDRKPIEFLGVKPHEEVEPVPEEVGKGLNSEILRAEEYLRKAAGGARK